MQISSLLRRAAQINPDGIATIFQERQQSWRQMADRVARLAGALQLLGMGPGDRVALLSLNSDRFLEYFYATVWGGGAMMPMNTRWAPAECAYALNDAGAEILLVDDAFKDAALAIKPLVPGLKTIVYCGDGDTPAGMENYEDMLAAAEPAVDAGRGGDDLAGIFYTGGTTGFPKGVMLSHTNFYVGGVSNAHEMNMRDGTVYLHAAPMFHIADLIWFTALTFMAGTHVVIPTFTPDGTLEAIEKHRPSQTLLVPVMLQMILRSDKLANTDISSLTQIAYGASPITESVLIEAFGKFPNVAFLQAFGQTELSPVATILQTDYHVLEGPKAGKLRSAGRPTRVCEIRIVDEDNNELPQGSVGQISVKGPITMLGYWNNPEVTAETIRDGWLLTGDAGYMDSEGFIFLMDRLKDMIVSGGENVYSAEVENALGQHPAVATSAVIGIPSDQWGESVHAIVILHPDATVTPAELQAHCHQLIAGYKCPRSVEFRSDPLPLSGANKVLKTELRKPYWQGQTRQIS
ncbi:long-chain-fatty-acid--CoA ligase [Parasedimentitalea psychrophila]|uniref:Long-chain-fatty-acid--CoA ligase n=1 Tax=Parasedimentitalea psychrophila TaxID=2997337 RepID=A0A9Y2P516_9RHOB|nr:long-chain-fatty-acid--CoA ligase [Parasedimentitalea psychrophila]WIY27497.1 long-chain-fatty-acid--CoA ligase [Parasedimentitalea psychrophila]